MFWIFNENPGLCTDKVILIKRVGRNCFQSFPQKFLILTESLPLHKKCIFKMKVQILTGKSTSTLHTTEMRFSGKIT